jgi:hypothetical protein
VIAADRKESKAKRKLEVNIQPGKLKVCLCMKRRSILGFGTWVVSREISINKHS